MKYVIIITHYLTCQLTIVLLQPHECKKHSHLKKGGNCLCYDLTLKESRVTVAAGGVKANFNCCLRSFFLITQCIIL